MTTPTTRYAPEVKVPTYIGVCCREWVMAAGVNGGTCGLCGQRPVFLRLDTRAAA